MTRSVPLPSESTDTDVGPAAGRGAPGRVAEMHAQTRRGLVVATGFATAAIVTIVARAGWWMPLHLFVVGGLLSAISAATQMLAVTWSSAPAPRPAVAGGQRWALAIGAVVLVVGHETDHNFLFAAGGATVVVAMLALGIILIRILRQAVTDRFAPAIEAYVAAIVAGAVGMSLGIVLGVGRGGTHTVELRGAHVVLNLFGLVGLVIAATLPYFAATQVRSKMSSRATPATMRITFFVLASATAIAGSGQILDRFGVTAGGLLTYAGGLLVVAAMLPVYTKGRLRWAGPRLLQLMSGIAWWVAMTVALALASLRATDDHAILQAVVIGGFVQILVASLAYFGPVLRGGGHQRLTAGFAITRSWVSLIAGNTAALAALVGGGPVLAAVLAVWLTDILIRAGRLLAGRRAAIMSDHCGHHRSVHLDCLGRSMKRQT
ncbi:MAG: hypothetical protein AB7Q27_03780 [Acidimicrobiia bacterium]